MAMANFIRESDEMERARASGWQLVQVAKAARLYVRNNSVTDPTGAAGAVGDLNGDGIADSTYAYPLSFGDGLGGISPQEITIPTLVDAGLLPQGFRSVNALKQNIKIVVVNYPLNGNPFDPGTVPSAYVVLVDSRESTPKLMKYVAEVAKEAGFPVSAPTFDATGIPIDDCEGDGQPDAVIWDSGCISLTEISLLATSGASIFPLPFPYSGSLIVPAWRSMQHDTRALMRYRQAENPDAASMVTNIDFGHEMTDAAGNCIREVSTLLPNGGGGYISSNTGLCDTEPDDASAATQREQDRRVDIEGVASIEVSRLVLSDQTTENPGTVEVSYALDGAGTHFRNPDGDIAANGLKNPRMAAGAPEETLGVGGGFSTDRMLHVGAEGGTAVSPAAYFADAAGTGLGTIVVESNLVLSDGNPATSENLTVNGPVGFGRTVVNSALAAGTLSVAGGVEAETVSITSPGGGSVGELSAQTVTVSQFYGDNLSVYGAANTGSMYVSSLNTDNISFSGTITSQSTFVSGMTVDTLSLGQASLSSLSGAGPDLSVDVYYVCPNPLPDPPPAGC